MNTKFKEFYDRKKFQYKDKFDPSDLYAVSPDFMKAYNTGERVTVVFSDGEEKRGTIGVTTGWKPVFLLMLQKDSTFSSDVIGPKERIKK